MSDGYADPKALVTTEWVAKSLKKKNVRLVEVDEDTTLYDQGHIPGAITLHWMNDLEHNLLREVTDPKVFAHLLARHGIGKGTQVIFYGDRNNWFAAYAYWIFEYYGHKKKAIMDGGRAKWVTETRPLSTERPMVAAAEYPEPKPRKKVRAWRADVEKLLKNPSGRAMVDVRSPGEFSGQLIAPPEYAQEGARRGGHIPTAQSIPWGQACNPDGTFKAADELRALYGGKGVTADKDVIAYCRIGERSSHTWFVLTKLLGFPKVRNYDGSWTEWGNLVNAPIEK